MQANGGVGEQREWSKDASGGPGHIEAVVEGAREEREKNEVESRALREKEIPVQPDLGSQKRADQEREGVKDVSSNEWEGK